MTNLLNIVWFLLLVLITVGSLLPVNGVPSFPHMDKFIHFGAYAFMAFIPAYFSDNRAILIKTVLILLMVGVGIEIAQHFVPRRAMSFYDFVANVSGIAVGIIAGRFLTRFRKR